MVVDELLEMINGPGDKDARLADGVHCATMAFADDPVPLEEEQVRVPNTLAKVEGFFAARGMEVNPRKSASLCARGHEGKSIRRVRPIFRIGGHWIRPVKGMDSFHTLDMGSGCSMSGTPDDANQFTSRCFETGSKPLLAQAASCPSAPLSVPELRRSGRTG